MTRRCWIGAVLSGAAHVSAKPLVSADRLSVLTDEVAPNLKQAILFAQEHGLKQVELRGQGGDKRQYYHAPLDEVREAARMLADSGIRVSFLNTRFLKWHYPDMESDSIPVPELFKAYRQYNLTPQKLLTDMETELPGAIERAHILGTSNIRAFSFIRVRRPLEFLPRVADVLRPMTEMAHKAQCRLLVENEHTTNVVTGEEMAGIIKLLPSPGAGLNWDPHNAIAFETPHPDGYRKLPKGRIGNVQIKAASLLKREEYMDWGRAAADLNRDGYNGSFGLEPHMGEGSDAILNARQALTSLRRVFGIA